VSVQIKSSFGCFEGGGTEGSLKTALEGKVFIRNFNSQSKKTRKDFARKDVTHNDSHLLVRTCIVWRCWIIGISSRLVTALSYTRN
jgi:hypothetical protein